MNYREFSKILSRFDGEPVSVYDTSGCAEVKKAKIGAFEMFLAENKSQSKSYKVKWSFMNFKFNLIGSSGAMGLLKGNVREMINSRDNEDFDYLKFKNLECEEFQYDFK